MAVIKYVSQSTLGPAYREFGYNEHLVITSRFLCIKVIDRHVKKFSYNEHSLITSSFFCIFLLVVSGTQCTSAQSFSRYSHLNFCEYFIGYQIVFEGYNIW